MSGYWLVTKTRIDALITAALRFGWRKHIDPPEEQNRRFEWYTAERHRIEQWGLLTPETADEVGTMLWRANYAVAEYPEFTTRRHQCRDVCCQLYEVSGDQEAADGMTLGNSGERRTTLSVGIPTLHGPTTRPPATTGPTMPASRRPVNLGWIVSTVGQAGATQTRRRPL